MLGLDVSWHWKSDLKDLTRIIHRTLEKLTETFILRVIVVAGFFPLCNCLRWEQKSKEITGDLIARWLKTSRGATKSELRVLVIKFKVF